MLLWSPSCLPVPPYIPHRSSEAPLSCVVNDSPAETSPEMQRCIEWLQAYFSEPQTAGSLPLPAFHHPALQGGLSWINICRAMTGIRLSLLSITSLTLTGSLCYNEVFYGWEGEWRKSGWCVSGGERTEHRAVTWFSNLWQLLPRVLVLASFFMILGTFFETDRIPLLTFSDRKLSFIFFFLKFFF